MKTAWVIVLLVVAVFAAGWAVRLWRTGDQAWRFACATALLCLSAGVVAWSASLELVGGAMAIQFLALYLIMSFRPGRRHEEP